VHHHNDNVPIKGKLIKEDFGQGIPRENED
jgi:hypothetical protein